ncbi:hypothetical protein HY994_05385 [Candidatus Micrarchaeota archaeon]|nr:hypothetical protein [Candidatus Micrarchaeota archaeon]
MDLVVDTNIVMAAIIRAGDTRRLLFHGELNLFSPRYVLLELAKYGAELRIKSRLSSVDFREVVRRVLSRIRLVHSDQYSPYRDLALSVCPDFGDWPFFAVAMMNDCPLWTSDPALLQQYHVPTYKTVDLVDLL